MENLTLGENVHYVSNAGKKGVCRHAVVITVDKPDPGLCIYNPQTAVFKHVVKHDENRAPGTWHAREHGAALPDADASPTV